MLHIVDEALLGLVRRLLLALTRERAQTLAEYGMVLTLVAVGVVIPTMLLFREELIGAFSSAMTCLDGLC